MAWPYNLPPSTHFVIDGHCTTVITLCKHATGWPHTLRPWTHFVIDGHCATVTPAPATMLFSDSCVLVAVRHLSTHFVASWNEGNPNDVYGLIRRPVLVPRAGVMVAVC